MENPGHRSADHFGEPPDAGGGWRQGDIMRRVVKQLVGSSWWRYHLK
jgi:hypothetical protein